MVLAEPDEVEAEPVEQRELLDRLGVDVLQRVGAARRAAEVVGDAEAQRRAKGHLCLVDHGPAPYDTAPASRYTAGCRHQQVSRYRSAMGKTATALELPPLTTDLEEAKAHLDEFGIARIADALDGGELAALNTRLVEQAAAERAAGVAFFDGGRRQPAGVEPAEQGRGVPRPAAQAGRAHAGPPHPRGRLLPVEPHRQHRRPRRGADGAALRPGLHAAVDRHGADDERDVDAGRLHRGERRHPPRARLPPRAGRAAARRAAWTTVAGVGPAGTALVFDGRIWHGTGANTTADQYRSGVLTYFCRPWLRPQENYTLSTHPDVLAELDDELQGAARAPRVAHAGRRAGPVGPRHARAEPGSAPTGSWSGPTELHRRATAVARLLLRLGR